jgi:hypothetical protein
MVRFQYDVESIGLGNVRSDRNLESAIMGLLNDRDAEGWEFVESHPSPEEPSTRLFVFRREVDTTQAG